MGNRARIAKVLPNGRVKSIHIQWAAFDKVGSTLNLFFDTEEKVDALLDIGKLDGLSLIPGKPEDYKTSYKDAAFGEVVIEPKDVIIDVPDEYKSFIRASVRNPKDGARIDSSYEKFVKHGYDMQRFFIYWENKWYVSLSEFPSVIPLEDALRLLMKGMSEEKRLIRNIEKANN